MIKGASPNIQYRNIIKKIQFEIASIPKVSFFHVKRENNCLVDSQANITVLLPKGDIRVNGNLSHQQIP
jgi:hypothetical protein